MLPHKELSKLLAEMALLLELKGENPFRVRAYESAALAVEKLEGDPRALLDAGDIMAVKGIGKGIAAHIREWAKTGAIPELLALREEVPRGLVELLRVPGLGPGKVRKLREALGVASLDALEEACARNRLSGLKGFGPASQEKICLGIRKVREYEGFFLLPEAEAAAGEALACLAAAPGVSGVTLAGSLRRFLETAREIVVLAMAPDPGAALSALGGCGSLSGLAGCGEGLCAAVAAPGIPARFRVVAPAEYPFALLHLTGTDAHVAALRGIASERGLELTPRGLFRGGAAVPCATEEEIYFHLGLPYIPPELRENRGEIEAASAGGLPRLVTEADIRGVIHAHTTASDGTLTIRALARAVRDLGYEYLGVTEHSETPAYAGGLPVSRLAAHREEVRAAAAEFPEIDIYWGIEADILPDGSLDYPDDVQAAFDFIIGSIHAGFTPEPGVVMARILTSLESPHLTMVGHPTGRILLGREGYPVDHEALLAGCAARGKAVELSADPHRLDLDWRWCKRAKELGVPVSVNPDAHDGSALAFIRYGVRAARKGWLEAGDVWNTAPREEMRRRMAEKPWRLARGT